MRRNYETFNDINKICSLSRVAFIKQPDNYASFCAAFLGIPYTRHVNIAKTSL